ncbi:protein mono-ADP-ribosyltransferase PARP14-like [Xyrauchen texanus]|uniref:protein mono-ADP-ribosyltransferase PARP14-like n=1 Tax=Xyrauchen texanus TaxID=154827 RepID=UPI0022419AEB|nr:protein mono-ADP-ribosyltransferase PARP14-like [Xyrauchen texanus]
MIGPHSAAEVRSRVKKVLERCEENQITTVSFPAVGTGGGGVKSVDAIGAMLQAFEDHFNQKTSTVIKLIYLVIDRDDVLQEFQQGLKTWTANAQDSEDEDDEESDCSSDEDSKSSDQGADTSTNPIEAMIGPMKVKVLCGDITKETVDAIVNSTTTSLDLSSGVSGAILKAAGQTVVNECKTKAPQPADGVVLTKAGNLSNIKSIIHMVGQTNEKGITSSTYNVLKMCEENQIQSVSFPALGTGAGNLAAAQVANAMIEALTKFVKDSPKHLKRVNIVIFQTKTLPDFQEALKKLKKISLNVSVLPSEVSGIVETPAPTSSFHSQFTKKEDLWACEKMKSTSQARLTVMDAKKDGWDCDVCLAINKGTSSRCVTCETPKPNMKSKTPAVPKDFSSTISFGSSSKQLAVTGVEASPASLKCESSTSQTDKQIKNSTFSFSSLASTGGSKFGNVSSPVPKYTAEQDRNKESTCSPSAEKTSPDDNPLSINKPNTNRVLSSPKFVFGTDVQKIFGSPLSFKEMLSITTSKDEATSFASMLKSLNLSSRPPVESINPLNVPEKGEL